MIDRLSRASSGARSGALGREAAAAGQACALVGLGLFAATLMVVLTIAVKLAA